MEEQISSLQMTQYMYGIVSHWKIVLTSNSQLIALVIEDLIWHTMMILWHASKIKWPRVHYITANPCQTDLIGVGGVEGCTKQWIHNFQTGTEARYRVCSGNFALLYLIYSVCINTSRNMYHVIFHFFFPARTSWELSLDLSLSKKAKFSKY